MLQLPAGKPERNPKEGKQMKERKNWAYGVSINGVGTVFYGREYFAREGIVNPLTAAPYTKDEITAIVKGADGKAEGYAFDLPEDAVQPRGHVRKRKVQPKRPRGGVPRGVPHQHGPLPREVFDLPFEQPVISAISAGSTASGICIQAASSHTAHRRNSGRTGAGISGSTATWTRQRPPTVICFRW